MNKVLDDIRARVVDKASLINSCGGEGCQVDMTNIPSDRVVIHVEREFNSLKKAGKRCDRLLFFIDAAGNNLVAVPIELKSGKAEQSEVTEKLKNSLDFAANIASGPKTLTTVYRPILFHGRGIKWINPKGTTQLNVYFRGKNLRILIGRCGALKNLAKVLSDSDNL